MKITSNEKACRSSHWRWWIALWWLTGEKRLFSLISSRGHCQRSSPSRICDTPRAISEPAQNLSSNFVEWNCAVVITTTLHYHFFYWCSVRKPVLKNFAAFKEKNLCWPSALQLCWKETPSQVFSCEYCEILRNTYFEKHLRMAASDRVTKTRNKKCTV